MMWVILLDPSPAPIGADGAAVPSRWRFGGAVPRSLKRAQTYQLERLGLASIDSISVSDSYWLLNDLLVGFTFWIPLWGTEILDSILLRSSGPKAHAGPSLPLRKRFGLDRFADASLSIWTSPLGGWSPAYIHERLAEYGWEPHQVSVAQTKLSQSSRFEISSSTISTVIRQPLNSERRSLRLHPRTPYPNYSIV